jgi:UDP-glucose 6-dehydrogenase
MIKNLTIGFIGQGWIGKHYADDFESRGFPTVRYSLEEPYVNNKEKIADCAVVFIAVPTPTTPDGFSAEIVSEALGLVGDGKIAVIKSTIVPGTTEKLQGLYPQKFILHSPEFLTEATAAYDAANPTRNIIGLPINNPDYEAAAKLVLGVLPRANYEKICSAKEAELIKYGRNALGFFRVIFTNLLYDATIASGTNWEVIREAMIADPDNGPTYMNPVHKTGRGAGGHCFIKDFATFADFYEATVKDKRGVEVLAALEAKNIALLKDTNKDLDLLRGVYGDKIF